MHVTNVGTVVSTAVFLFVDEIVLDLANERKVHPQTHLSVKERCPPRHSTNHPSQELQLLILLLSTLLYPSPHAHNGPLLGNRGRCRHPCTGKPSPRAHHVQVPHLPATVLRERIQSLVSGAKVVVVHGCIISTRPLVAFTAASVLSRSLHQQTWQERSWHQAILYPRPKKSS